MSIKAYFENIKHVINNELLNASSSVKLAIAWFTDEELFSTILTKAQNGIKIELIILDDEINNESGIDFDILSTLNGKVWKISNKENNSLMHNKFCIIDQSIVITGSYNWSYKARRNHENITIARDNIHLINQFVEEFYKIISFYFPQDIVSNEAATESYAIISYNDFSYQLHKNEYELLKIQIIGLETELEDMKKVISDFTTLYDLRLGPLILKLLELKKEFAEKNKNYNEFNEVEEEIHNYQASYNVTKNKGWKELGVKEFIELKAIYRKATKLCHPDLVHESEKKYANDVFNELRHLYELNDVDGIKKLYNHLKNGAFSDVNINKDSFKIRLLKNKINQLKIKRDSLESEILNLRNSNSYITVSNVQNIDEYLDFLKKRMENEINELENKNDEILTKN